jgi:hypothetical protein
MSSPFSGQLIGSLQFIIDLPKDDAGEHQLVLHRTPFRLAP